MHNISLFIKEDPKLAEIGKEVLAKLEGMGYKVVLPAPHAQYINRPELACHQEILHKKCEFMICLGGDGTVLRAARFCSAFSTPLLGVNIGKIGFLTEVALQDLYPKIEQALTKKDYVIDERKIIEAKIFRDGHIVNETIALNDIVINKGDIARLIRLDSYVDDHFMTHYRSDGLIVSTATGSTAYNLSAGGPILAPHLSDVIITPICPTSISIKPVVLGVNTKNQIPKVKIKVIDAKENEGIKLTADGQTVIQLNKNDEIVITQSEKHKTCFIRFIPFDFFSILRRKLEWGVER